jgi:hypothetical protein
LRRLRASLAVARGFERLHREGWQTVGTADAALDLSPIANVPEALTSARSLISSRQREVNSYVRRDFHWLASLFLLAVILFETFANLFHDNAWLLGSYLLVLGGIGLRALRGRWMLWEATPGIALSAPGGVWPAGRTRQPERRPARPRPSAWSTSSAASLWPRTRHG